MKKNEKPSDQPRKQCGALPFRVDDAGRIQVLLVTSRETRRWVIPKGWPIRKLRPSQTAAREAYEEAGLAGPVSKEPYGVYTYEKRLKSRAFVPCAVDVFLMQVEKEQKRWPERDERERRWFDPQTASELVDEPELSDLIAALPDRLAGAAAPRAKRAASG
jgi:8-oxo-dGTP pyrophosphatase MutT (NUDIX family)